MPISAAFSTCSGVPPSTAQSAPPPSSRRRRLRPGSRPRRRKSMRSPCRGCRSPPAVSRKSITPTSVRAGDEARVVVQHGGHDAGRAVRRRGDDAAAGSVLLVHRQRVEVHPVEHLQRVAQRRFRVPAELPVQFGRTPTHLEAARQRAVRLAAAHDAGLHDGPDAQQAGVDFRVTAPVALVAPHQIGDRAALAGGQLEQVGAGTKRQRQHGRVRRNHLLQRAIVRDFVTDDEAAADGIVEPVRELGALCIEGREAHAVGVEWQCFAAVETEVGLLVERNRLLVEQSHAAFGADGLQLRRDGIDIDAVGLETGAGRAAPPCRCRAPCRSRRATRRAGLELVRLRRAGRRDRAATRTCALHASVRRCASCSARCRS